MAKKSNGLWLFLQILFFALAGGAGFWVGQIHQSLFLSACLSLFFGSTGLGIILLIKSWTIRRKRLKEESKFLDIQQPVRFGQENEDAQFDIETNIGTPATRNPHVAPGTPPKRSKYAVASPSKRPDTPPPPTQPMAAPSTLPEMPFPNAQPNSPATMPEMPFPPGPGSPGRASTSSLQGIPAPEAPSAPKTQEDPMVISNKDDLLQLFAQQKEKPKFPAGPEGPAGPEQQDNIPTMLAQSPHADKVTAPQIDVDLEGLTGTGLGNNDATGLDHLAAEDVTGLDHLAAEDNTNLTPPSADSTNLTPPPSTKDPLLSFMDSAPLSDDELMEIADEMILAEDDDDQDELDFANATNLSPPGVNALSFAPPDATPPKPQGSDQFDKLFSDIVQAKNQPGSKDPQADQPTAIPLENNTKRPPSLLMPILTSQEASQKQDSKPKVAKKEEVKDPSMDWQDDVPTELPTIGSTGRNTSSTQPPEPSFENDPFDEGATNIVPPHLNIASPLASPHSAKKNPIDFSKGFSPDQFIDNQATERVAPLAVPDYLLDDDDDDGPPQLDLPTQNTAHQVPGVSPFSQKQPTGAIKAPTLGAPPPLAPGFVQEEEEDDDYQATELVSPLAVPDYLLDNDDDDGPPQLDLPTHSPQLPSYLNDHGELELPEEGAAPSFDPIEAENSGIFRSYHGELINELHHPSGNFGSSHTSQKTSLEVKAPQNVPAGAPSAHKKPMASISFADDNQPPSNHSSSSSGSRSSSSDYPEAWGTKQASEDRMIGQTIKEYNLVERLGVGSFASVYRVEHTRVNKSFAMKLLHSHIASQEHLVKRFQREVRSLSMLNHPNVVQITDTDYDKQFGFYFIMEWIPGISLSHFLKQRQRLSYQEILNVFSQILSALAFAHDMGISHRDLKPGNIMILEEKDPLTGQITQRVKILDFSLATFAHDNEILTMTGAVLGSPKYMAPEQAKGTAQEIDSRADLYACGIILGKCLTGSDIFTGDSPTHTLLQQISAPAPKLKELCPSVQFSQEIEDVFQKAVRKEKSERYQSATEFFQALREALYA